MKTDILLTNVPIYTHRPYVVGISSLNEFLKLHGVKAVCFDPVTEYVEQAGESYSNFHIQEFDAEFAADSTRSRQVERLTEYFLGRVGKVQPRMLGFSVIGRNVQVCLHLAKSAKERFPEIKTIVGGPAAALMEAEFPKHTFLDYLFLGEAETGFQRFFESGAKEEDIAGLVFRDGQGHVRRNCAGETVCLDSLPIGRHDLLFDDAFYKKHYSSYVPVVFSRGCPFKCTFCTGWKVLPGYRFYPLSRCLDFLRSFEGNSQMVLIEDSIMNGNENWLRQLCTGIIDSRIGVKWGGVFRIHPRMAEEGYFDLVAKSGCISINFGLESGSSKVLKHLKKFHNVEKMYKIFDNLRKVKAKYPVKIAVLVIVGAPLENEEDFQQTLKFLYFNRDVIDRVEACTLFNLDEDLPLYEELKRDHSMNFKSYINWATRDSSPKIRLRRMREICEFFDKLGLRYNMYDNGLSKIPEDDLVEWVEPSSAALREHLPAPLLANGI